MTEKILAGKKAIVTGASAGMGAATALRYAEAGADIWAVGGSNTKALQETIDACTASGVRAGGKGYDFSQAKQAEVAVREGANFLGGLDILFNCAGGRVFKPILEVTDEDIEFIHEINIKAIMYASREAVRIMAPQGNGHIIMIGSAAGIRPKSGRSLYSTTKAAVHSFTESLAIELGPRGIHVNCIAPGLINSGSVKERLAANPEYFESRRSQIPVGRVGNPEEIAALALFLVSPENDFMTGSIISIDGGTT